LWHENCFRCLSSFHHSWRKEMTTGTTRIVMLGLAALTMTAGCAGESASRRGDADSGRQARAEAAYQEELERAEVSIAEAERGGAYQHGAADLNRAREKVNAARRAAADGDWIRAERMVVEAELDADLALATARNEETQAAANELQESIRTLDDELRRNDGRSPDRF
jgi:hypothetical protein